MSQPAKRGKGAVQTVLDTIVNVITLPFRLLGQLFGRRRR